MRKTKQREVIQNAVVSAGRPLSPAEIFEIAKTKVSSLSLATVYRFIKSLVEDGELVAVSLPGAPDRYETKECAAKHHHHFHCRECGKVFDIPGCGLKIENNLPQGFNVQHHEVMLYGDCRECSIAA